MTNGPVPNIIIVLSAHACVNVYLFVSSSSSTFFAAFAFGKSPMKASRHEAIDDAATVNTAEPAAVSATGAARKSRPDLVGLTRRNLPKREIAIFGNF